MMDGSHFHHSGNTYSDSDEMLPLCVRTGTVMPGLGEGCAGVPGAGDNREDCKGRESVLTGRDGRSRETSSSLGVRGSHGNLF